MDLFLISANRETFPDPVYPLGAAYVADAARRAGHHVRTRDLMWEKDPPLALLEDIRRHPPDAIALSFRNLDNAAWPLTRNYLPSYRLLVQNIRKALPSREIPLILGGSAFSLLPDLLLEELDGDYGISGEGERSFSSPSGHPRTRRLSQWHSRPCPKKGIRRIHSDQPAPFPLASLGQDPSGSTGSFPVRSFPLCTIRRNGQYPDQAGMPLPLQILHLSPSGR